MPRNKAKQLRNAIPVKNKRGEVVSFLASRGYPVFNTLLIKLLLIVNDLLILSVFQIYNLVKKNLTMLLVRFVMHMVLIKFKPVRKSGD